MRKGQWLAAVGALLGCLMGAGFASGQEVLQFFTAYGPWRGAVGAGLMLAVLYPVTAALLAPGAAWGPFWRKITPVVSFAVYAVMLAGAGAVAQQSFGCPAWVGSLVMAALTLASCGGGLQKLVSLLGWVGPVVAMAAVGIGLGALAAAPAGLTEAGQAAASIPRAGRWWWLTALQYGGVNALLLAPFATALGQNLPDARTGRRAAACGCGLFAVAVLAVHFGLSAHLAEVATQQAPTAALIALLWPGASWLAGPLLETGIYTTAVPLLYCAAGTPRRMVPLTLAGTLAALLPFGRLVGMLYPLLGWLGLVMGLSVFLRLGTGRG